VQSVQACSQNGGDTLPPKTMKGTRKRGRGYIPPENECTPARLGGMVCATVVVGDEQVRANLQSVSYHVGEEDLAVTELIESNKSELKALCERYRVERLAPFGSALRGDFDPAHSDLDFCVEFQPMTPEEHAGSYFGLLEELQDLFARRVDLVEIAAVRNPYLRQEIEALHVTLYAAA
jgi:uncharacterized protein